MSRSKRIFGRLAQTLPGMMLCKDMLVVTPTEHIVRGFVFETTMLKDHVYVWKVVAPLYRPMDRIYLDYSDRIADGEYFYINPKDTQEAVETVRGAISGHIDFLKRIEKPDDFMRHIEWAGRSRDVRHRFDFALTQFRIGNIVQAQESFIELNDEVEQLEDWRRLPIDESIKQAAQVIRSDPAAFERLLDSWERESVAALSLEPTLVKTLGPATQSYLMEFYTAETGVMFEFTWQNGKEFRLADAFLRELLGQGSISGPDKPPFYYFETVEQRDAFWAFQRKLAAARGKS